LRSALLECGIRLLELSTTAEPPSAPTVARSAMRTHLVTACARAASGQRWEEFCGCCASLCLLRPGLGRRRRGAVQTVVSRRTSDGSQRRMGGAGAPRAQACSPLACCHSACSRVDLQDGTYVRCWRLAAKHDATHRILIVSVSTTNNSATRDQDRALPGEYAPRTGGKRGLPCPGIAGPCISNWCHCHEHQ
jgi:hypothetical protein